MDIFDKDYLNELFEYRDGELFYKQPAGKTHSNGYKRVCVAGKMHPLHRIIYMLHHGYMPELVDHIDGNKQNNRIENLRSVTNQQNQWNRVTRKNTSGAKNVCWHKQRKKWQVRVCGKSFGLYDDFEEAKRVATEMREKLHGEYANHEVVK